MANPLSKTLLSIHGSKSASEATIFTLKILGLLLDKAKAPGGNLVEDVSIIDLAGDILELVNVAEKDYKALIKIQFPKDLLIPSKMKVLKDPFSNTRTKAKILDTKYKLGVF